MDGYFDVLDDFSMDNVDFSGESPENYTSFFSFDSFEDASGGTEGDDYIENTVNGAVIEALGGDDTIDNSGSNVTINAGDGNNYINNYSSSNVLINAGSGDDTIDNDAAYVTINAGDGNNYISNWGSDVTINAGDGNNLIDNNDSAIINTGSGNDSILNYGSKASISSGAGNDYIENTGYYTTINAGAGDDSISLDSSTKDNLIQYKSGDGNDLILGFNEYDTLQIGGGSGTYSKATFGNDIIITVGKGQISLMGAASLAELNISGKEANSWKLNGTTATYGTSSKTLVTVSGVKSLDGLVLNKKIVTISKASLNNSNVTISDGYTLQLGSDVTKSSTTAAWGLSKTTATYKQTTSAGYTLADNKINYFKKATNNLITVTGVKSVDGLTLSGKVVTVSKAALGTDKVTISDGYTLKLGSDVTKPTTNAAAWSIKNSTATYKGSSKTAGYTLASDSKSISYSAATTASTLATVKGVKSVDGLSLSKKVVTVSKASLGTDKVTISGDGYTLKLGSDVTAPKTTNAWSLSKTTATYKQTTTAGYTLADNAITYTKKATSNLVTVKGVKSVDGLSVSKKVVTVSKASLGTDKVTISDGYTLKLGSDVTKPSTTNAWSLSKTTATYKQTTSAGYTLSSNAITYNQKATSTLATVSGVKSIDGLSLSKKVVTVSKASLGTDKVTISDGYTLKLGSDVSKPTTKAAAWSLKSSTATYKGSSKTAGYTLASDSKSIAYSKATTAETLATIKGVKSTSGLSVSGKKVTLKNSALSSKVTIGGSYEFNFASDYKNATIAGSSSADKITVGGAKVSIDAGAGNDTVKLTSKNSTILGGAGKDTLTGSSGVDTLNGGAGNDIIFGDSGNDSLFGDKGNDSLNGGAGNDSLWGGAGNDTLIGGDGKDVFIFRPGEGTDTITDYASGDMLKILDSKGKNVGYTGATFKSSKLTLTIDGGGSVVFNGVKSGDKININGTTHTISGKTLK